MEKKSTFEVKPGVDFNSISYLPHIKDVGFNPSPVAGRIPKWADGRNYPKVVGTNAWREFWEEQINYCLNGYDTGGLHISGIYYDFLNFKILDGALGVTYPDFIDTQFEIFDHIQFCKENNKIGLVLPKKRRIGLSFIGTQLIDYGIHYIDKYKFLIGSGLESYTNKAKLKLESTFNNRPKELMLNVLKINDKELQLGWEEKTEQGFIETSHAHGYYVTFRDNPKKAEGDYFNDVLLDEIGDFPNIVQVIASITPALKMGDIVTGFVLACGTGGNVLKGGKGLQELYHEAESMGFMRYVVLGKRYYLPCVKGIKHMPKDKITGKQMVESTPYLDAKYPNLKPEQLLGCEDVVEAQRRITQNLKEALKNPNKKLYRELKQSNPESIEDIFTSSGSNDFNTDLLFNRLFILDSAPVSEWTEWVLDWVKDEKGKLVIPLQVKARAATKDDNQDIIVSIKHHPRPQIKNLDVGGIDGYNDDETQTSKSLGAMVITRQNNRLLPGQIPTGESADRQPVFHYALRPKRKEIFWEICLKASVYYNLLKNTLIAAESDRIIKYYKANNGKKYLSPRPKSFDAPDSKLVHDYGAKMTGYSKPLMLSLMQSEIEDFGHALGPQLLVRDCINYDTAITDNNDWDSADAWGLSLMRIADMKQKPTNETENKNDTRSDMYEWIPGPNGHLIPVLRNAEEKTGEAWEKFPSMFDEYEKKMLGNLD